MKKNFKLYYTSDTHGFVFPTAKGTQPSGIMQCIKQFEKDGNTLVLDGGDTIQGSPLTNYLWEEDQFEQVIPHVFNYAGYDYFAPGNHDFNYGYRGLSKYINSMKATCLAANVVDTTNELPMKPYVIHTIENGLRIGICGIVTDYVNLWEAPENLENLKVTDSFLAAKKAYDEMADQCDFTICIYHGGFESDLETGKSLCEGTENVGYRICKELGYDLLLTAHQHMLVEGIDLFGTFTLQLPANAAKYAKVCVEELDCADQATSECGRSDQMLPECGRDDQDVSKSGGRYKITAELLVPEEEYSEELLEQLLPIKITVDEWLAKPIGSLSEPIEAEGLLERAVFGAKLADLSNLVQLDETKAEIACTGLSNAVLGLESIVSLNSILKAFPFANEIVVLEVPGATLLKALERCASYFDLVDGNIVISDRFTKPKEEHYNYDYYAGVNYSIDLNKAVGERVSDVSVNGEPLNMNRTYTVAMSDYRATGTGGYDFFGQCKRAKSATNDIQQSVIRYMKEHQNLTIPKLGKIKFI